MLSQCLTLLLGFQVGFRVHLKLRCLLFSESEVKQCCFLWLFSVFSLLLHSRPTASQAESGFSFFSHFRSSSFRWKNSFIIISISFCASKYCYEPHF